MMAWAKFDDRYLRHPKIIRVGRDARDLHIASIIYACGELTDGFVPAGALRMLAADAGIDDARDAADRLLSEGLWEAAAGGWMIHDFLEYNRSASQVKTTREARAQAGAVGGTRSGESRRHTINEANAEAAAKQTPSKHSSKNEAKTNPVPVPLRSSTTNQISVHTPAAGVVAVPDLWTARYTTLIGHAASGSELQTLAAICRDGLALDSVELGEALSEALATPNCRSPAGLARTILQRWHTEQPQVRPAWRDAATPPTKQTGAPEW